MVETLSRLWDSGWLASGFAFVSVASTLIIIIIILSENRNPVKSLAWVTVLLLLPVVGVILYLFFGRNIKNKRMISRRNRRILRRRVNVSHADPRKASLSENVIGQINLGRSVSGSHYYAPNEVDIFTDGASKFEALEKDLLNAERSINMQYYIFEDDKLGNRIADILIDKVSKGVKVRLIYDHVGSFHVRSSFFKRLQLNGVEAYPFFRVSFPQFGTHVNWRNHRKICVIDDSVAYLGGMNIADRYVDGGKFLRWRDTHVRVIGPVVSTIQASFAIDWSFLGGGLIDLEEIPGPNHFCPSPLAVSDVGAQLITSGPTSQWPNIAMAFHKAIANAKRRVFIQTPYFLPTEGLLRALEAAALAHVDVRVMIPEHSDSVMLTNASASYIDECLRAGIKIYMYKSGMLHAKMIIVDDEIASIGSTNFDFRSFDFNFEANLFFYSQTMVSRLLEIFRHDQNDSIRINPVQWKKRPFFKKAAESILRLLSPIL